MSTVALNNLLTYILSLGLSTRNKTWLAEKLLDSNVPGRSEQEQSLSGSRILSDEELTERLSMLPSYDDSDHNSMDVLSKADYQQALRYSTRKAMKGIEKWL